MNELSLPGYDRFRLLGRGGFSAVYEARQVAYDRQVAVKVLDIGINDEVVRRRVLRERAATGRLTGHPNIVTILDSGFLDDGRPFLTMALCPGGSLADRVGREGPLPLADVLHVGVRIAGALETAHRNDITHRDVKPENILLTAYGEPALADFGISTVIDQRSMTRNTQAYTPNHAPPEVLRGEPATVRSDIYNLGSTLYQLLAGHPPFALSGSAGLAAFVDRVLNQEAPPPRDDLPDSLLALLRRAMAKDPAARFASAADLGAALQEVQRELGQRVDDLPVLAGTDRVEAEATGAAPDATILPPQPTTQGGVFVGGTDGVTYIPRPETSGGATTGAATVLPPNPGRTFAASAPSGDATMMGEPASPSPPSRPSGAPDRAPRKRWLLVSAAALAAVVLITGGVFAATGGFGGSSGTREGAISRGDGDSAGGGEGRADESPTPGSEPSKKPAPRSTGPVVVSVKVTNVQCQDRTDDGWRGTMDVEWRAERADNVQIYAPNKDTPQGGYDGRSGKETFEMPCVPGELFRVRAVPQMQSLAGPAYDFLGGWPNGARLVTFEVRKYYCDAERGELEVTWTSDNADNVRLFLNDTQFTDISTAPNDTAYVSISCKIGETYAIRGVAYKGGTAGGSRQTEVSW